MRRVSRIAVALAALPLLLAGCTPTLSTQPGPAPVPAPAPETPAPAASPPPPAPPPLASRACDAPGWRSAAAANAASLNTLAWAPFGRPETGWAVYVPLIQHEIATSCPPASEVFAARLSDWARPRRLNVDGVLTEALFQEMKGAVQ